MVENTISVSSLLVKIVIVISFVYFEKNSLERSSCEKILADMKYLFMAVVFLGFFIIESYFILEKQLLDATVDQIAGTYIQTGFLEVLSL